MSLEITAAVSAIDAGIQNKIHGSVTTTLIISYDELNDTIKIVQALQDSNISLKGVTNTIKNKAKQKTKRRIFKHVTRYFRS